MWFWRGTQSAIFYYVSLSPCLEYNHKRRRRKEANRSQKERAALELQQPGMIYQPVPFQTNQYWAEEIKEGPGPPRGWTRHNLDDGTKEAGGGRRKRKPSKKSVFSSMRQDATDEISAPSAPLSSGPVPQPGEVKSGRSSRRASTAGAGSTLDALKDTIRSTIARQDTWNWKRYEREDETLFGINDRISRMWDRATSHGRPASTDRGQPLTPGRKRAATTDSDEYSWRYARNPGVNDMHPPTVSQLPRTKREVAWMMQPPPSRAVMEGKVRPWSESGNRRPLCMIGGSRVRLKEPDGHDGGKEGRASTANRQRVQDMDISPGGTEYKEEDADGEEDDGDEDDGDSRDGDSSASDYSRSTPSLSSTKSSPSPQQLQDLLNDTSSQLRRPPLAVLVHPNQTATKFRSYHLPIPPPKVINARSSASPTSSPPLAPDLDVLLGVVLPQLPERSRYSLPNVRLCESAI